MHLGTRRILVDNSWRSADYISMRDEVKAIQASHSPLEREIFEMYSTLALGRNSTCQECANSVPSGPFSRPVSIWHVGAKFGQDDRGILFAGKTARGQIDEGEINGVDDTTSWANRAISNTCPSGAGRWAYWAYTRDIIGKVYGSFDEGWEQVAFTSLVKCNASATVDKTSAVIKNNCRVKL